MRNRLQWLALACSFFASTSAMASATSTAKIHNLTFTLYDLDPTDGITPSFQFLTGPGTAGSTSTYANANDNFASESGSESLTRAKPFQAHTSDISLDNALAIASVQQFSVSAHGQAAGVSTGFSANAGASSGSQYGSASPSGIELAPNSLLVIRADGIASASIASTGCTPGYYCYSGDSANANVSMSLSFSNSSDGVNSGNGSFMSQLSAYANANGSYQYNPVIGYSEYVPGLSDQTKSGVLSVAFTNNTSNTQRAFLSLTASVNGSGYSGSGIDTELLPSSSGSISSISNELSIIGSTSDSTTYGFVASIPEPGTWAMMLIGLVGIGLTSQRSRRRV